MERLSEADLDRAFDMEGALSGVEAVFERVLAGQDTDDRRAGDDRRIGDDRRHQPDAFDGEDGRDDERRGAPRRSSDD